MKTRSEGLIDTRHYSTIRPRLLAEKVHAPSDNNYPVLVRETEDGKPTGRWMVLDCTLEGGKPCFWAWPPVASNDNPNTSAWRFP